MMRTPFGPVHLPPEYRMQWVEGEFRLSDAGGNLLFVLPAKPGTLADLGKYAWQHAWRQMEKEVRRELQQLRDGTLTIKELRRMRQYLRLLEALAEEAPQAAPEMTLAARVGRAGRSLPRPRPHEAGPPSEGGRRGRKDRRPERKPRKPLCGIRARVRPLHQRGGGRGAGPPRPDERVCGQSRTGGRSLPRPRTNLHQAIGRRTHGPHPPPDRTARERPARRTVRPSCSRPTDPSGSLSLDQARLKPSLGARWREAAP